MRIKRYMIVNPTRSWVYYTERQWLARLVCWLYRGDDVRLIDNKAVLL